MQSQQGYQQVPSNENPEEFQVDILHGQQFVVTGYFSRLEYFYGKNKDMINLVFCGIMTSIIWNVHISGISKSASETLGVFLGVMLCLLITNLPIGLVVSIGLSFLVIGKSMECETKQGKWVLCKSCGQTLGSKLIDCDPYEAGFKTALSGYSQPLSWMILCAFHLGYAVQKTNLGQRVSLILMKFMGHSALGLGMAIFLSELALGPFIPSNTARGGGIIMPIVMSLIQSLQSSPYENSSIGTYLILCGTHANLLVSSIFLTGAAPNPIIVLAAKRNFGIDFTFSSWFIGAILPGFACFLLLPILFLVICKPDHQGDVVVFQAKQKLHDMGPMSVKELQLLAVLGCSLILWTTGDWTDIPETFVSYLAFVALVLMGTISWEDVISNSKAWDTFFWLSGMIVMAEQLAKLGIASYFGEHCATLIQYLTKSPIIGSILLSIAYFYSMYCFSSITGHAMAFAGTFMVASKHMGSSPFLICSMLGYFSSLSACLTPFSTGSVVLYFSQSFIKQTKWFTIGLLVSFVYVTIYSTIGLAWWKVLDYF